jgi:hypothetical protein
MHFRKSEDPQMMNGADTERSTSVDGVYAGFIVRSVDTETSIDVVHDLMNEGKYETCLTI